jgi:hypothetical protein
MENNDRDFLADFKVHTAQLEQGLKEQPIVEPAPPYAATGGAVTQLSDEHKTPNIDFEERQCKVRFYAQETPNAKPEYVLDINEIIDTFGIFDKKCENIDPSKLIAFFKKHGFIRISRPGDDTLTIIQNKNKILKPFNWKTDTLSFIINQFADDCVRQALEFDGKINKEFVRNGVRDFVVEIVTRQETKILRCWKALDGVPYDLNRDKKDCIYLPFKNCVAKITSSGIKTVDYSSDEIKFFVETESMRHEFKPFDLEKRERGMFEQFLIFAVIGRSNIDEQPISEREQRQINAFYSMIGYLISNYKDPAGSPAIILSDADADDEARNGGRGKSLLAKALTMVRENKFRGNNEFDPGYRHNFADLEPYHDIYILDDVPAGFNYDGLYSQITGDITAERKGQPAVTIPFDDAPKFVITTNWAVRYDREATSTNRRFIEYKFSDFWNINNTPDRWFGRTFFLDWDETEWQRFFEFLIYCSKYFLTNGLEKIEYDKAGDNFRAYFSNDARLEVFETVFSEMEKRTEFSAMDFLNRYKELYPYERQPLFTHINAKKFIDVYIEFRGLKIKYEQRSKKWQSMIDPFSIGENDDDTSTSADRSVDQLADQLPF